MNDLSEIVHHPAAWNGRDFTSKEDVLGTHSGERVSQSVVGHRLGHVRDFTHVDPDARHCRNKQELISDVAVQDGKTPSHAGLIGQGRTAAR